MAVKVSSSKEINDAIKRQSKRSKTVKITGLNGQNYICAGLKLEKQLTFEGTAGDFFGALNHGPILNIKGDVRRFLGDSMSKGGIILQGNAARGVGITMSGGIIVIRGNVNGDVGQFASGGTIIVSGDVGSYTGAHMFNGELIIAGNIGKEVGFNMVGGAIFVGGKIGSIGPNAQIKDPTNIEIDKIKKYFKHYGISKNVDNIKKIISIKRNTLIDSILDFKTYSRTTYNQNFVTTIIDKTKTGLLQLSGPTNDIFMDKKSNYFEGLSIITKQTEPIKDWNRLDLDIDTSVKIGNNSKSPLVLSSPFYLESRSVGTVSVSSKLAFLYGASKLGIPYNTGGTTLQEELELNGKYKGSLIHQWGAIRLGINLDYLKSGAAIELVLGRAGTGALPGIIPPGKITKDLCKLWNIADDVGIFLPPKLPDLDVPADIKRHVELLKELTDYKIPIIIRFSAGSVYDDTKLAIRAGADAVVIDCLDSIRQDIITITANNLGLHSIAAIPPAVEAIKDARADKHDFKLFISGFFKDGADIFKGIALGADGVVINTPAEIAIGCTLCGKCHQNICPAGIGSTDPKLEAKLDLVNAGEKLINFINSISLELKVLMLLTGCKNISQINKDHLLTLDYDIASITGVKLGGYNRRLPIWEH